VTDKPNGAGSRWSNKLSLLEKADACRHDVG